MKATGFRLRTLGAVSLEAPGGSALSGFTAQRKAIALIVLLARAGAPGLSRDKILPLLWPESDTDQARSALANLLFRVRRALGADVIAGTADLRLDPAIVASDVAEFEHAVKTGDLERAAACYAGPFLDGFYVREAPEFERWATEERARLASVHHDVLERLALRAAAVDDRRGAVNWWRQRAEAEPLNTRIARAYVEALIVGGEREVALAFVAAHSALVRSELDATPDPTLVQLSEQLRQTTPVVSRKSDQFPPDGFISASVPEAVSGRTDGSPRPLWRSPLAVGPLVIGALALAALAFTRHQRDELLDPRRVVIARFDNRTGDSALDAFGAIAAEVITEQLARTAIVSVVDPVTALASSNEIRKSATRLDTPDAVPVLASRTHAGVVVTGSYYREHDTVVAEALITDAGRNVVLAATEPVRGAFADRNAMLEALRARVVGALALRLDERLTRIVPPGSTPTYDAYQAFVAGVEVFMSGGSVNGAEPYFERAYALDTTFVEPLVWEGFTNISRAINVRAADLLEKRRSTLSEIDRFALDFNEARLTGTTEQMLVAGQNAARLAPGSHWTHNMAYSLFLLGRVREAIQAYSTVDREHGWLRSFWPFWDYYIKSLHVAGMHHEELSIAREARAAQPASVVLQTDEVIALAMSHTWGEFDDRIRELEQRHAAEQQSMLTRIGAELRLHGDTVRAKDIFERAVRSYDPGGAPDPQERGPRAIALYLAGHWAEAAHAIDSLQILDPRNETWPALRASVDVRTGNRARAAAVLDSLVQTFNEVSPHFGPSPGLGKLLACAQLAAVLGDRERAIALLGRWRHPYDPHYEVLATEFESLKGYAPYQRMIAPH